MTNKRPANSASVERLLELWADRYIPNWSTLHIEEDFLTILQLVEVALPSGRVETVTKVRGCLQIYYDIAWGETNTLFSYIPNVLKQSEALSLTFFVKQVYEKILEIYQQQSLPAIALLVSPALEMPVVEHLAKELDPVLLELQKQYLLVQNPCAVGFISTPFHFCNQFILSQLTAPEQVLISPYFKFVEEQVCIPWQRVCAAAAQHHLDSPTLALVQQMLPLSQDIAETVYRQASQLYFTHRSRRGGLSDRAVALSVIRDLDTFQGYLWLCVLEESMTAVEQELIPMCLKVFPCIDVSWELVRQVLQLLVEELLTRMEPEPMHRLVPYVQAMQQLFSNFETRQYRG